MAAVQHGTPVAQAPTRSAKPEVAAGGPLNAAARRRKPSPALDRGRVLEPPSTWFGRPDRSLAGLIDGVASRLGLDLSTIEVRVGHGERGGSASPTRISLSVPLGQRPAIGTVAHELAHVAQHRNRERPAADPAVPDNTAAEAEARAIGDAAAAGAALWTPRQVLPDGRVPRLQDASGVLATTPPPMPETNQPSDKAKTDPLEQLDELVRDSRSAERRKVSDGFHGLLTLTHDAVEQGLQVLDGLEFPVARALVRTLDSKDLIRFAHLEDDHHRKHPVAAATVLSALPKADSADFQKYASPTLTSSGPLAAPLLVALHGLSLAKLSEENNQPVLRAVLTALATVLGRIGADGEKILVGLERGDRGERFRELLRGAGPAGSEQDMLDAAIKQEKLLLPANREQANPSAGEVAVAAQQIADAFAKPTGPSAAGSALAAFASKVPAAPAAQPQSAAPTAGATSGGATSGGATPGGATSGGATSAGAVLDPGQKSNAPLTATEFATAVLAALDRVGTVDRILDDLPQAGRYSEPTATPLKRMLAARSPALTLPRIEKLLSYGVLNWWWVSDANARFAYLLVRSLPLADQDAWRTREAGKWFDRLERNYPFKDPAAATAYTGVGSEFRPARVAGTESPEDAARRKRLEDDARHATDATAPDAARRLAGRTVAEQEHRPGGRRTGQGRRRDEAAADRRRPDARCRGRDPEALRQVQRRLRDRRRGPSDTARPHHPARPADGPAPGHRPAQHRDLQVVGDGPQGVDRLPAAAGSSDRGPEALRRRSPRDVVRDGRRDDRGDEAVAGPHRAGQARGVPVTAGDPGAAVRPAHLGPRPRR